MAAAATLQDGGRLVTDERSQHLQAFNEQQGNRFSPIDLEIIARMGVSARAVAEHIIFDDRDAILGHFDEIIAAARPAGGGASSQEGPSARYERLRTWRDRHRDSAVRNVSDADLGRLATAPIGSADDLGRAAATLKEGARIISYADELLRVLGVRKDESRRAEVAPEPPSDQTEGVVEEAPEAAPQPQPTPPPTPEPAPVEEELPDSTQPFQWVQVTRFKGYDWSAGKAEPQGEVYVNTSNGPVQLEWAPLPGDAKVKLYRIVSSGDSWPTGAPEMASLEGVTLATAGSLPARPVGQVTYFAVWANQGDSVLAASQSQPILVGSTEVVWPPPAMTVNVTPEKKVAGTWTAPAGSRVEVQRFRKGRHIAYDQSRLLPPDAVRSGGFLDSEAPQGVPLVYAAFCVADLPSGGSAISEPTLAEVEITPEAQQVRLDVQLSKTTPGTYDISWVPPAHGTVALYALRERPPQGLEREVRSTEILEGQGIRPEFRITYPVDDLGGLSTIRGFVVDHTWVRAHFVAVHEISAQRVWMGPPVSMVTPRPPQRAEVIERVDAQVLTFPWPHGVSIVEAYQSPLGMALDPQDNEPIASLTRDDYDRTGGMRITRTLPSNGCTLHLFGVVYLDGQPVHSVPTSVDYPGMTRLRYELVPMIDTHQQAPPGAMPSFYRLFCTSDDELHELPIVIVGNPRRLPLEPEDGEMIQQAVISLGADQRVFVGDLPVGQRPMTLRMFIHRPAAEVGTVAVLDPRVDTLHTWI